ncbi:flagellar hook-associated protein FlgK [Aminiphilus circumscriptus]|uniref:flagellar hook-associated protein FlgK n=1 Tax=Aminiphilus circumscriptus TaxID=290732 RepID=UPI0004922FF5|nr:flagellar hook-associated protein FlgK [Aminiphilus circumscriptus]
MVSTFFGLEMGKRALNYFRTGMDTAGHNISNADIEGYSRQRVQASSTDPYTVPGLSSPSSPGQIGTGVGVDAIVRIRDAFLDMQYREETTVLGYWEQIEEVMNTLEVFVGEPSTDGLSSALDDFWSALQEVHTNPESSAAREELVQKTITLTTLLDQLSTNYTQYREALNEEVALKVQEANNYIDQIAALNGVIAEVQGVGGNPNDLLDSRDLLVEKLCKLIDCTVSTSSEQADGDYKIYLDGRILVQGTQTRHLVLAPVAGNLGYYDVQVEDNEFDYVDNPDVLGVIIEQQASEAVHVLTVERLASETSWEIGNGNDRVEPQYTDEALNLSGSFSITVSSSGTQKTSSSFDGSAATAIALDVPASTDPTSYQFRIASGDFESIITASWNAGAAQWELTDNHGSTQVNGSGAGGALLLSDLQAFLSDTVYTDARLNVSVGENTAGTKSWLKVASTENSLLSFTDVKGDLLAGKLGMADEGVTVEIEITEEDTLETIRNKINGHFAASDDDPDSPEQWLHAEIRYDEVTNSHYLVLQSNVVGEAYRINVGGDEGGSLYAARKLGLVNTEDTALGVEQNSTSVLTRAQDAVVMLDGVRYMSSENTFTEARLLSKSDGYAASTLQTVCTGIHFTLKATGTSGITVDHHVQGGEIAALLEARDDIILSHLATFDEIAYELAQEMNAIHYAGHGYGDSATETGIAYFDPIALRSGASTKLSLNAAIEKNANLIAAASDDGNGYTCGSGDGSNVLRMAQLKQATVLNGNSASFNGYYETFIAKIGSEGLRATTMASNQRALVNQIETQRQSVMGVNLDEEMMDIILFNQAFNAMSRFITTQDEILDKIINGMGVVGR